MTAIQEAVYAKADPKEKMEEWLVKIKEIEKVESVMAKARFYSPSTLYSLMKTYLNFLSLSESSRNAAMLLKMIMRPDDLVTIVNIKIILIVQSSILEFL